MDTQQRKVGVGYKKTKINNITATTSTNLQTLYLRNREQEMHDLNILN